MSKWAIGLGVIAITLAADAAEACDQGRFEGALRWCLVDGRGAIRGRGLMYSGLKQNNAGTFMSGFRMCQAHDDGSKHNGGNCYRADRNMPLRLGHRIAGR